MRYALVLLLTLALSEVEGAAVKVSVTDADGKPVADAVVFAADNKKTPKPPAEPLTIDQVDKEFVPHLLVITAGTSVRFPNKDDIHHEIYSFSPAKTFELPLYKGEPAKPVTFADAGVVKLGCNIHDWMSGVILVLPDPRYAVTGADGTAKVDVPEGTEVFVFHERLKGSVEDTKQKAKDGMTWSLKLKAEKKKKRTEITTY